MTPNIQEIRDLANRKFNKWFVWGCVFFVLTVINGIVARVAGKPVDAAFFLTLAFTIITNLQAVAWSMIYQVVNRFED